MRYGYLVCMMFTACSTNLDVETQSDLTGTSVPCDWPQIYGTSDHAGRSCAPMHGMRKVAEIVQDPDVAAETLDGEFFLQVHESPVVTFADWLIVPTRSGVTLDDNGIPLQDAVQNGVSAYRWIGSDPVPVHVWDQATDFRTIDAAVNPNVTAGYVQQFAVLVANGSVYVPAAHGQLLRLSLATGAVQARINPFAGTVVDSDPRLVVNNAPMVRSDGTVYYTAVAWSTLNPANSQPPRGAWLVKVLPSNDFAVADWSPDDAIRLGGPVVASPTLGVPTADSPCERRFGTNGIGPTGPDSKPPLFRCGLQRPAINSAIAYSDASHHLLAYSYANNASAGYLIEIDADTLAPIRAADMRRNGLRYGCGVRIDILASRDCQILTANGTTNLGVDPRYNGDVHASGPADLSDNSPTISPDGTRWTIGFYDSGFSFETLFGFPHGFDARGAMVMFDSAGALAGNNPDFGWQVTAGVFCTAPRCLGWQWVQDRNLYSDFATDPRALGIARYTQDFGLQSVAAAAGAPFGDFVDGQVVCDANGGCYGVNELGYVAKTNSLGQVVETVQLIDTPIEVTSGYLVRARNGMLIATYAGKAHLIASSDVPAAVAMPMLSNQMRAAHAAKFTAAAMAPEPPAIPLN